MDIETESHPKTEEQAGLTASEDTVYLFQPDPLVLAQFVDDRRGKVHLEPEKRLMLAILEDAVCCFQDNYSARKGKRKRLFENVQRWFFGVNGDWVFSFESICSVLGLSAEYVRKGLVRWMEKELSKQRSASGLISAKETPESSLGMPRAV